MSCRHRFTDKYGNDSHYVDKCDYCGKKIPYCSNIRGGKHRFTDKYGNDSHYVNKCDYCGGYAPYCSNIRGGKHRFTDKYGNDSHYVDKCDYCGGYAPYCSNIRGGKHRFTDEYDNDSHYVDKCDYCGGYAPYCSNIRGGKHRFTDEYDNDSHYVDKCDYCGGYAPYCSNIRGGKHHFENGKCEFCNKAIRDINQQNQIASQYNLDKATNYLISATINSTSNDPAYCARFVQNALEAEGFSFQRVGHAYQMIYILPKLGFSEYNFNNYIQNPQNGDIVVEEPAGKHTSGHVQMWCSKIWKWVSYFRQSNPYAIVHNDVEGKKHYFRY